MYTDERDFQTKIKTERNHRALFTDIVPVWGLLITSYFSLPAIH